MKKQAKGIIALSAVLAAMLGGGYAYLKLSPEEGSGNNESSAVILTTEAEGQGTILVSDNGEAAVVERAVVKNSEGVLNVVMKDSPSEQNGFATYTLEDYEDLNVVDYATVATLVNNGNGIQAQALVAKDCTDLAKFGLDKPAAEVEFTYQSGNKVKFYVGDESPSSSGTYFMVEGSRDVYTVSSGSVANYQKHINRFISRIILANPEEMPRVDSLRIHRSDMESDIYLEYDKSSEDAHSGGTSSSHIMLEPVESYLGAERSEEVLTGMFGLSAVDIYSLGCEESDIAEAGLSEPFCTVTMECSDGKTYKLLLSEIFTDDSGKKCSYAMMEEGRVIYVISADNAKWLTVKPLDIASRLLITSYVWNITELSVKGGSKQVDFVIEALDKDNIPDNPTSKDFKVTNNGKDFDSERYREFYSFLVGTNGEEFAVGVPVPVGEPVASISYYDSYREKTLTYEFYDDSVMRSLIVINGESKYYCTNAYVKVLIDNIMRIDKDEDFVTNW